MTLIFLSHLAWGGPETSRFPGCSDKSDVSMVAEPNGTCGNIYTYINPYGRNQTALVKNWFLCKTTNTCIHEDARLESFHLIK